MNNTFTQSIQSLYHDLTFETVDAMLFSVIVHQLYENDDLDAVVRQRNFDGYQTYTVECDSQNTGLYFKDGRGFFFQY